MIELTTEPTQLPYVSEEVFSYFNFSRVMHDLARGGEGKIDFGSSLPFFIEFRKRNDFVMMRLVAKPIGYSSKKEISTYVEYQRKKTIKEGKKSVEKDDGVFEL